jgi:hypothetical protein
MNMQTVEHDSTAVACVSADSETPNVGYAAVRFNAMKHGILSRLAVLAHEDQAEFSRPAGRAYSMNINRRA